MYKGWTELLVDEETFVEYLQTNSLNVELPELPNNSGVIIKTENRDTALAARYKEGKGLVKLDTRPLWDGQYYPLYPEMQFMWDFLWDPNIEILSLDGIAGTGKTFTAMLFGLHFVLNEKKARRMDKVVIIKPYYPSSRSVGLLPGGLDEKLDPAMQSYYDALRKIIPRTMTKGKRQPFQDVEDMKKEGIIEVMPLEYARGRNIEDAFVILDEAQNTDENELVTFLTRNSTNCKVVVSGDTTVQQKDRKDLRNQPQDGLTILKECFKGLDFYAHVTIDNPDRILRGKIAKAAIERIAMRQK